MQTPWWCRGWVVAGLVLACLALPSGVVALAGPKGKGVLDGFVEDHRQKPLLGAQASLWVDGVSVGAAESDASGKYTIEGLPSGRVVLRIRAPGCVALQRDLVIAGKGRTRALDTMDPGVSYGGTVTDAAGAALADVLVGLARVAFSADVASPSEQGRAGRSDEQRERVTWAPVISSVRTDAQGRFALDGAPPRGKYIVRVAHPHYEPRDSAELAVAPGLIKEDIVLALKPAAWIRGRVVDEKGKAVKGAIVRCEGLYSGWEGGGIQWFSEDTTPAVEPEPGAVWPTDAVTAADGSFETGGFTDPGGELFVDAPGFLYATVPLADLQAGVGAQGLEIVLVRSPGPIEGTVVDHRNKPVPDAHLQWWSLSARSKARTGKNGKFTLTRMKSSQEMELEVQAEGFWSQTRTGLRPGSRGVKIQLEPEARWHARIGFEGQATVARVEVRQRVLEEGADPQAPWNDDVTSAHYAFETGVVVATAALPRGRVQVRVSAEGYEPQVLGPYETQSGQDIDAGDLVLAKRK